MIQYDCKKCGHHYCVSDNYTGKRMRCKPCGTINQIPPTGLGKIGCSDSVVAYNRLLEALSQYEKNAPTLELKG